MQREFTTQDDARTHFNKHGHIPLRLKEGDIEETQSNMILLPRYALQQRQRWEIFDANTDEKVEYETDDTYAGAWDVDNNNHIKGEHIHLLELCDKYVIKWKTPDETNTSQGEEEWIITKNW